MGAWGYGPFDNDSALDFYTKKLGMEVRSDVTLPEMGNFRWLAVGPAGQPDIAITLMAIPGPPVMDPDTAEQVKTLEEPYRPHRIMGH
jgi:catechol 2,3-dioxygenase-like lactoylglutathione lyase family enzyme